MANWSSVLNAVREHKPDSILHIGSILSIPSEMDPWSSYRVNCNGMFHVLEAARLFGVEKVAFTSSIGSVMCPEVTDVMTDFTLQRPRMIYGVTKLFGELLGRYWNRRFGLDFRALRYPSIIGPGVRTMGVVQCLPWALEYAVRREPYDLWLSEDTTFGIMYVKDAARAIVALHDARKENIKTMCYNIAGITPAPTAGEWVKAIKKHIPEAKLGFRPASAIVEELKQVASRIDDSKARKEWGWEVQYPIDKLIPDFIEEYEKAREAYEATPIPSARFDWSKTF